MLPFLKGFPSQPEIWGLRNGCDGVSGPRNLLGEESVFEPSCHRGFPKRLLELLWIWVAIGAAAARFLETPDLPLRCFW